MRRPTSNDHHGAHVVETKVVGGTAARLRATSHWTTRSGALQSAAVVLEEVTEDRRRGAEGHGADGAEGAARHSVGERVAADDVDVGDTPARQLVAEARRPGGVLLESDDVRGPPHQREGPRAASGPDLDDEVVGFDGRLRGQCLGELSRKEVLAETATPLVPRRPLVRGHGSSS